MTEVIMADSTVYLSNCGIHLLSHHPQIKIELLHLGFVDMPTCCTNIVDIMNLTPIRHVHVSMAIAIQAGWQ